MVAALKTLREGDAERHLTQKTLSRVERIQVVERSDEQITIAAQIRYADEIADANGTVVERNRLMRLRNTYTFTRTDGSWKLSAWNQTAPGEPLAEISDPLQGGPA
jgi:predicted lipid-binding transport protein (Tim44 family)